MRYDIITAARRNVLLAPKLTKPNSGEGVRAKKIQEFGRQFSTSREQNGEVLVKVTHRVRYDMATPLPTVTDGDMAKIENISMKGLSSFQICATLRSDVSQI